MTLPSPDHSTSPVKEKTEIKPPRAIAFEHLFPGNNLDSLPKFNPLNIPRYIKRLLLEDDLRSGRALEAIRENRLFMERVELPNPDQLTMAYEMASIRPFSGSGDSQQFTQFLQEGEQIGGIGILQTQWLNYGERGDFSNPASFISSVTSGENPYISGSMQVAGVIDRDGRPKALIQFKGGKKLTHTSLK